MPAARPEVARRWQFTNYKFDNIDLETFCEAGLETETALRYICFGHEICPTTGKPHMQGYVELRRPMRRASVQKLFGRLNCDPKLHIEAAHALRSHNQDYCRKGEQSKTEWDQLKTDGPNYGKNAKFFEAGSWESGGQGARTDLIPAIDHAKTAPSAWSLIEQFPTEYCKYSRGLDRIRVLAAKRAAREYRPIEVHVLWGDPGTRKTDLTGLNKDHDVFPVSCGDSFPFDNYDGEGTIVFDDFYGQLRIADMLSWCNGQYGSVNIKGGSAYRAWTKVYITSNTAPDSWYPNVPEQVRQAFLSRLTTVTHVVGACQRPATKYFILNTLSSERNEVDCNTTAPSVPENPLPCQAIDDQLVIAAIADLFGDTENIPEPASVTPPPTPTPRSPAPAPRLKGKARKNSRPARASAALPAIPQPTASAGDLEAEFRQAWSTTLGKPSVTAGA